jgi:hypothetical protein
VIRNRRPTKKSYSWNRGETGNAPNGKKWTAAKDAPYDRAHGIKEGPPKDNALDKKRGVPIKAQSKPERVSSAGR